MWGKKKPKPTYQEYKNEYSSELSTVESQRNEIIPEEFPEGPYGAPTNEARLGKATGWEEGQHVISNMAYENRNFHQDLSRQEPASHPTHDDPNLNEEPL
ncbi:hypothetical protein [Brevibacillus migulae]|uniref:hypothetical protein n=1 Tax=Brevibacillus migulae TaxID=1644114 RepID=UPI00106EE85F|nr:hypothetical protein [Brevibacillus migulae]